MSQTRSEDSPRNDDRGSIMALGSWRLVLALLVVNGHLHDQWWAATFAVFSFYVISGFLITCIMNRNYGFTLRGIASFFLNRVLRIYPPYYAGVILSLVLLAVVPSQFITEMNRSLHLPESFSQALRNLTLVGLHLGQPSRLVPPAWALHIELCFYAAIGLFLGRGRILAVAWLLTSIGFHLVPGLSFEDRYFTLLGSSLPFAAGAVVYHFGSLLDRLPAAATGLLSALLAYGIPFAAVGVSRASSEGAAFYANIATSVLLVHALTRLRNVPARLRKLDGYLGDLAYPVYLFHWQTGILAMYFLALGRNTVAACAAGAILATGLAVLEVRYLTRPIERVRLGIKQHLEATRSGGAQPQGVPPRGG